MSKCHTKINSKHPSVLFQISSTAKSNDPHPFPNPRAGGPFVDSHLCFGGLKVVPKDVRWLWANHLHLTDADFLFKCLEYQWKSVMGKWKCKLRKWSPPKWLREHHGKTCCACYQEPLRWLVQIGPNQVSRDLRGYATVLLTRLVEHGTSPHVIPMKMAKFCLKEDPLQETERPFKILMNAIQLWNSLHENWAIVTSNQLRFSFQKESLFGKKTTEWNLGESNDLHWTNTPWMTTTPKFPHGNDFSGLDLLAFVGEQWRTVMLVFLHDEVLGSKSRGTTSSTTKSHTKQHAIYEVEDLP